MAFIVETDENYHFHEFRDVEFDKWSHSLRFYITPNHQPSLFEIVRCVTTLQLSDFQRYCRNYFKQIHIEVLIQANINGEQALNAINRLLNRVKWGKFDDVSSKRH